MPQNTDILVTGGTGVLGKALTALLQKQQLPYVITSRSNTGQLANWRYMNLENNDGVDDAVKNKHTIFHLASATRKFDKAIDVDGTARLLKAALNNGVEHFIYISIVGIDKVPLSYYEYKLQAEKEIIQSGIPYTIIRATQFYDLIDFAFTAFLKLPVGALPKKIKIQPIDVNVVAGELLKTYYTGVQNKTINIGGMQVFTSGQLLETWLQVTKKSRVVFNLPLPGEFGKAVNNGGLTCTEKTDGSPTWENWLKAKYSSAN